MSQDQRTASQALDRPTGVSSDDPADTPSKSGIDLSIPQLLAGALAAASAAFAASWLGVAGTVLGAVLASVVVSVSTALYKHSLERSTEVLRETLPVIPAVRTGRAGGSTDAQQVLDDSERDADSAATSRTSGSARGSAIRWGMVAATGVLILVSGFGILTVVEAVLGESASSLTGHDKGGTTVGRLINSGGSNKSDKNDSTPASGQDTPAPSSDSATTTAPTTVSSTTTAPETSAPASTEPPTTSADPTTSATTQPTSPAVTTPASTAPTSAAGQAPAG